MFEKILGNVFVFVGYIAGLVMIGYILYFLYTLVEIYKSY